MLESLEGFGQRIRRLNPLFTLGRGMDLGLELNPYVPSLLMHMILQLFYRELNDDDRRTKQDIESMAYDAVKTLGLSATDKQIQRIANGLVFQGTPLLNQPFEAPYYDEVERGWNTQIFRYVTMDDLYTNLEIGGPIIYKLTEQAQEMVFMSREITEEFSITIEQLYSIQLIKNGNFSKATRNLDVLLTRVRTLLDGEIRFHKEMISNPKILVIDETRHREEKKKDIEKQFDEERKHFKTITSLVERAQNTEEYLDKEELYLLFDKVEFSRQMHDRFANQVILNISTEINLKTENPSLFWERSLVNFRENVYENWLTAKGVNDLSALERILQPFFSPDTPFILPLEWVWGEQEFYELLEEEEEFLPETEDEEFPVKRVVDWSSVADAWEPIMDHLQRFGEFSLKELSEYPYEVQDRWFEEYETLELWMMFDATPFMIEVDGREEKNLHDEREMLLYHLMQRNERHRHLERKIITVEYEPNEPPIRWYGKKMTPYTLYLKEAKHEL
jgi:hypothetical protein